MPPSEPPRAGRAADAARGEGSASAPSDPQALLDTRAETPAAAGMPEGLPRAGRRLGDYLLLSEIGRGGMGVVYEAEQISLKRRVALKVLHPHLGLSGEQILKFRREAEAGGRQHHPGIVAVHAVGEHEGLHFIAQELIPGGRTLADRLAEAPDDERQPRGYFREIAGLFADVAEALGHAHANGVVHRDVKPSNILLPDGGPPKIGDFGLAKLENALALTRTGEFEGTPYYMSPEQIAARGGVDHRTDIYSLGVTLYEALTLVRPFAGDTSLEVLRRVLGQEPADPRRRNPRVPRDLAVICLRAMEKAPQSRYATMADLAADLRRWLAGEAIIARPVGPVTRCLKLARRNRGASMAAAAALAAGLFVAAFVTAGRVREGRAFDRLVAESVRLADEGDWDGAIGRIVEAAGLRPRDALVGDRHRLYLREKEMAAISAERAAKERALDRSAGMRLAGQAERLLEENPGLALLLALEAERRDPDPRTRGLLADLLARCREARTIHYRRFPFLPDLRELDRGHFMNVSASPDGRRILTTSYDNLAAIWDAETGERLFRLDPGEEDAHGALSLCHGVYSPDGRRVGLVGRSAPLAFLFDAETGAVAARLAGHGTYVSFLAFSPDGRRAATASIDSTARLWDVATGECLRVLRGHEGSVVRLGFSPDGRLLATASSDLTARVWAVESGECLRVLRGHEEFARAVRFSPDGRLLASADDLGLRLWEVESGRLLHVIRGERHPDISLWEMEFSPDGSLVTTTWGGLAVQAWSVADGRVALELRGHEATARCSHFSSDGRRVMTAAFDNTIRLWDARSGRQLAVMRGHDDFIHQAWFTAGDRRVVTIAEDMTARIWDAVGDPAREACDTGGLIRLAFTKEAATASDGRSLAILDSLEKAAFILDPGNPRTGRIALAHEARVRGGRFSSDGLRVVTGSEENNDGLVLIWDARSGELLQRLRAPAATGSMKLFGGAVCGASFFDGDSRLAATSVDGAVRIWDLATGEETLTLEGHQRDVVTLSVDRERGRFLSASMDGTARVWSAATGGEQVVLRGHSGPVTGAVFSPDGRRVATVSTDGTARLWDAVSGEEQVVLRPVAEPRIGFSPDGARVVAVAPDGTTRGWPVDPVAEARRRKPRELTPAEKKRHAVWDSGEEEALALVERLFDELVLARDVIARIEADAGLRPEVVSAALAFARLHEDDRAMLHRMSAFIEGSPGSSGEMRARAARYRRAAERLAAGGARR
ncbi:MAG: protein kinase [Candidatus Eisenbacteria bacterium]|uniref:Protein kinase n=1 Tax=Eiseniibacteriota bacterium TaxID=2212470 RepID=A0A938BQG5_UNCEI|nr:protein kinase [Candidatus Eisenbacteria bacterium]